MPRLVVAAIVVSALAACIWFMRSDDSASNAEGEALPAVGSESPSVSGKTATGGGEAETPLATNRFVEPQDPPIETEPTSAPEPGSIRLRVVDGGTREDLEDVWFRAVSDTRVLQARVSSPCTLDVPGGKLALLFRKAGYERERLDVEVDSDARTQDVGTVALARGRAVIDGRLELGVAEEAVAVVQLFGDGRGPFGLPRCERSGHEVAKTVCRWCGWGAAFSQTAPERDAFRFERLSSGSYLLVARDGAGTVLATKRVALQRGETRPVVIRVAFRDVTVRVEDASGQPFDGLWHEDGLWYSSKVRIFFWMDGICSAAAEVDPADAGYVVNQDEGAKESERPRKKATAVDVDLGLAAASREREHKEQAARQTAGRGLGPTERPRKDGEDLWPRLPSPTPRLKTRPLGAVRISPGTYEVRRVPVAATRSLASCGPMFTMSEKIDLTAPGGRPLLLVMRKKCGADTRALRMMARSSGKRISCTACHALPTDIFQ